MPDLETVGGGTASGGDINTETLNAIADNVNIIRGEIQNVNSGLPVIDSEIESLASAVAAVDALATSAANNSNTNKNLLENATYGLAALNTDLDSILTHAAKISDGTIGLANLKALIDAAATNISANKTTLESAIYGLAALKTLLDTISGYTDLIDDATNGLAAIKTAVLARATPTDVTTRVQTELNGTLTTTPNAKSLWDILNKDTNLTYSKATDSLEAIRDYLEASIVGVLDPHIVRSSASGSKDLGGTDSDGAAGSEKTLLEKSSSSTWKYEGGWIDLTGLADTRSITIKVYIKLKSGGDYKTISTEVFTGTAGAVCIPIPAVIPIGGTSYKVVIPNTWNVYGLKITAQQTVAGAGYLTIDHEHFVRGVS
jgi:archaellum component FlaC